jgi:hypothetical protein
MPASTSKFCARTGSSLHKRSKIGFFDPINLGGAQARKLLFLRSDREPTIVLPKEAKQQIENPLWHFNNSLDCVTRLRIF